MSNLVMEDASILHTLKPGVQNDYVEALKGIEEAFSPFSNFKLAYGVGARTHTREKGSQDSCDLFSMSGSFQDPFVHKPDEMLSHYESTLKTVRLALPVNYQKVIKFVCDLAQMEFGTCECVTQIRNYYVLVLLMAGVIDDFEEAVNEVLRAKDIPVSVVIVKVGAQDEQDCYNMMSKTYEANSERQFISLVELDKYKLSKKVITNHFAYEIIRQVPNQIEKFYELQGFELSVSQ